MNALVIGSNKEPLLRYTKRPCLIVDDGPFIDALAFPRSRTVVHFDVATHCLNPLKDMDYRRARDFIAILNAVFPEGESTLTKRNSDFVLLNALLDAPKTIDRLISDSKETRDAYQKIQTLLLSPVLERVLNHPSNVSLKGTVIARLDRAVLGDFDCFVLGNLLISQYPGQVVVPDFGFYAHKGHAALIRQNRLIAGINAFSEVPDLKSQLLLIDEKLPSHSTPEDAETLAAYLTDFLPGTTGYGDFIRSAIA